MKKYVLYIIIILAVSGAGIFFVIKNIENKPTNVKENITNSNQEVKKTDDIIVNPSEVNNEIDNDILIKEIERKAKLTMPEDMVDSFIAELKAESEDPGYMESLLIINQQLDELIAAIENSENTATTSE